MTRSADATNALLAFATTREAFELCRPLLSTSECADDAARAFLLAVSACYRTEAFPQFAYRDEIATWLTRQFGERTADDPSRPSARGLARTICRTIDNSLAIGQPPTIPTLSLRQPWGFMVTDLNKDIENRRWPTKFRGRFLIHAAKGVTRAEYKGALDFAGALREKIPTADKIERGGIIGIATLVDCRFNGTAQSCDLPLFEQDRAQWGDSARWAMLGQYGFRLEDIRTLPFIPCKGSLSFFRLPPEIVSRALSYDRLDIHPPTRSRP